jgi:hypothetical protein
VHTVLSGSLTSRPQWNFYPSLCAVFLYYSLLMVPIQCTHEWHVNIYNASFRNHSVSTNQTFRLLSHDRHSLNDCFCENNSESHMFHIAVRTKWPCADHVKMAGFGRGMGQVYVWSWQTSKQFSAIMMVMPYMVPFASPSRLWRSTPVRFSVAIPRIFYYSCHIGAKRGKRRKQCHCVPTGMAATNRW